MGDVDRFGESAAYVEGVGEGIDECGVVMALDFIGSRTRDLVLSHSYSPPFARSRRNVTLALRSVERTVAGFIPSSAAISAGVAPS